MTYSRQRFATQEGFEEAEDLGEIQVAEYIVFLMAFDTYQRYLDENNYEADDVSRKGVALLRMADRLSLDSIFKELDKDLPSAAHKRMLARAYQTNLTPNGLARRALQLRTVLSRGGATTMRSIFKTNRALTAVRDAIESSMMDDADAALDKFAVISVRNVRFRDWITVSAETAGSGTFQNAVEVSSKEVADDAKDILSARIKQQGTSPTSEQAAESDKDQLTRLQAEATEAARKALEVSGETDQPPSKSEVVGIATAAAVAAVTNPDLPNNIPEPLRKLDEEQRAAALTDGRVLVAAGAGAGKSTTLISRMKYLIRDKGVSPSRIFAASFNKMAAVELQEKAIREIGPDAEGISIGTMHSLFRKFIMQFGTPDEKLVVSDSRMIGLGRRGQKNEDQAEFVVETESGETEAAPGTRRTGGKAPTPSQITYAIKGILKECGPEGISALTGVGPKTAQAIINKGFSAKGCKKYVENWKGNNLDFKTARDGADTVEEFQAAIWYEMYLGLKGDLGPAWKPPCGQSNTFGRYIKNFGVGDQYKQLPRYGDSDDMIRLFRDILKRNPDARKTVQDRYDHICVDEAQDLNVVQHEIFSLMSEGFEGKKEKSLWMVGDDKQSIYQFRGARPSLFSDMAGKEGWNNRLIQTNYRCEPEIVEAANRIAANNTNQIPMTCRANPKKPHGKASIDVLSPEDYTDGAYQVFQDFDKQMELGKSPNSFAVLARTNAELNAFEDQCILREIPYKRSKGSGFLESPETSSVLGYMDLAMSNDNAELMDALKSAIGKPDRGTYLSADALNAILDDTLKITASNRETDVRSINPLEFITEPRTARELALRLKEPYRNTMVKAAEKLHANTGNAPWLMEKMRRGGGYQWMFNNAVDQMADHLLDMGQQVVQIRRAVKAGAKTSDVLDMILDNVKVIPRGYVKRGEQPKPEVSLRQQIKEDRAFNRDPEEDDDETASKVVRMDGSGLTVDRPDMSQDTDPLAGLGAVRYLYQLAEANEKDRVLGVDPQKGSDFYRKIDRYKHASKELQDSSKFPERVTLSTIHSVKGSEWENVALCMSYGFFPPKRKEKVEYLAEVMGYVGEQDPRSPEKYQVGRSALNSIREDPVTAERNLAYVGVTRAKQNLKIVSSQERVSPSMRQGNRPVMGQFVREAGWGVGENVKPPQSESDNPLDQLPTEEVLPSEGIKTASLDYIYDELLPPEAFEATTYSYGRQ